VTITNVARRNMRGVAWAIQAVLRTATLTAGHELRASLRGRLVPAFAALFTVLAVGISLAGLGASGQLVVQGFTRTAVSLMTLALYLLPLLGAIIGAAAIGGEDGGAELLLAQPIGRAEALLGRAAGLAGALAIVAAAGFGVAAIVVAVAAGVEGMTGYALVALGATTVGVIGVGIGVLVGVLTRRRTAAVVWALATWFGAAVLYDLAAIGVLQVVGNGQPGPWLVALLTLNPIDGVRALGLVGLGADVLLGPTGAALQRMLGSGAATSAVVASLAVWLALPMAIAVRSYRRRDF
jgi:Cu-processing system permease protein